MSLFCKPAVLALGSCLVITASLVAAPKIGDEAPAFSLADTHGKTYNLVDVLKDDNVKAVVLEWFNHDCPVCARHAQEKSMISLVNDYQAKGVVFLGIDSTSWHEGKTSELNTIIGKWEVNYPILTDFDGKIGHQYGAKTTPHLFIINKQGQLAYDGAIDDDKPGSKPAAERTHFVREALDQLLSGETIARSKTQPYGCSVKYKK